mmetsp:Transcript_124042/g.358734  ORF Transcript_124042/g.358734 Transcript_124042/m.358734 type:complete len:220 (+) Transcript_124042:687-1346(+)
MSCLPGGWRGRAATAGCGRRRLRRRDRRTEVEIERVLLQVAEVIQPLPGLAERRPRFTHPLPRMRRPPLRRRRDSHRLRLLLHARPRLDAATIVAESRVPWVQAPPEGPTPHALRGPALRRPPEVVHAAIRILKRLHPRRAEVGAPSCVQLVVVQRHPMERAGRRSGRGQLQPEGRGSRGAEIAAGGQSHPRAVGGNCRALTPSPVGQPSNRNRECHAK